MGPDRLQLQRWELKYIIGEAKALAIRDFVKSYLELDEHAQGKPDLAYAIHSLYLDSDQLATYWDTINGLMNRLKLRLRYYADGPEAPVFFEIKRRSNDAILKKRGGVRREAVDWLMSGQLPEPRHLLSCQPWQLDAVQRFSHLMLDLQASPKLHVTYLREAWVSTHDNSIRVTMDRNIRSAPEFACRLGIDLGRCVKPFGNQVVLELKFTGHYPNWFRDLVGIFNLARTSASKYADGVEMIGEDQLYRRPPVDGHPWRRRPAVREALAAQPSPAAVRVSD
jgi:hypothetical protein